MDRLSYQDIQKYLLLIVYPPDGSKGMHEKIVESGAAEHGGVFNETVFSLYPSTAHRPRAATILRPSQRKNKKHRHDNSLRCPLDTRHDKNVFIQVALYTFHSLRCIWYLYIESAVA